MGKFDLAKQTIDRCYARDFIMVMTHCPNHQLPVVAVDELIGVFHRIHLLRDTIHNTLRTKLACQDFFASNTV